MKKITSQQCAQLQQLGYSFFEIMTMTHNHAMVVLKHNERIPEKFSNGMNKDEWKPEIEED